jgi:hypothetical protein
MRFSPALVVLSAVLLAAAGCRGEPLGTRQPLQPAQVAGIYQICELSFVPTGSVIPPANLLALAMDPAPESGLPRPNLKVDLQTPRVELEYTPRQAFVPRRFEARYALGSTNVTLSFLGPQETQARTLLLLPNPIVLRADTQARTLTTAPEQGGYTVSRADYARVTGVPEDNLAPQISGTISARFAASCS